MIFRFLLQTLKGGIRMKTHLKYAVSLALSQTLCFLIYIICLNGQIVFWKPIVLVGLLISIVVSLCFYKKAEMLETLPWITNFISIVAFFFTQDAVKNFTFNEYSITACVFLILNTIFCVAFPRTEPNPFFGVRTEVATESPAIWSKVHQVCSLVACFFEIPLFLLICFVPGVLKFILCIICLLGSVLLGAVIGHIAVAKEIKECYQQEQQELKEQLRREEGYR